MNRAMAVVMVGFSGRTNMEVAPNSPRDTVKAKTPAAVSARAIMGRSTDRQTCWGDAPSTEAASLNRWGMEASAGCRLLITKGRARVVCANGTKRGEYSQRLK